MMPVKDILDMRHLTPRPPVLVIDETTIKCTSDAGPVCGCDEKYDMVKNYKAFIPGGVHPYARKSIPDNESLQIHWQKLKVGSCGYVFEKPVAVHQEEIPEGATFPEAPIEELNMFLKQPKYTEGYLIEKRGEWKREHSDNCNCPGK